MLQKVVRGDGTFILWEPGHFIVWESDHLSSGNRTTYHLGIGTFSGKRDIPILWERFYPLGIGTLILWESDHLSSGIRDILWETGHGKRDTLSSGNRTTYPLGNGNFYPLGIGKRGDEVQPEPLSKTLP